MSMNVIEALNTRRSVRAYTEQPVARETIMKIIEAANAAPSAVNSQPWEVFVAAGEPLAKIGERCAALFAKGERPAPDIPLSMEWPESIAKRQRAMMAEQMKNAGDKDAQMKFAAQGIKGFGAPVVAYLCLDKALGAWSLYDLGAFSQSFMLAAVHYGLSTVPAAMLTLFPDIIREELKIPDNLNVAIGIALGYGADNDNGAAKNRRPLDEFVSIVGI